MMVENAQPLTLRRRLLLLGGVLVCTGLILMTRLAVWQMLPHKELAEFLDLRPDRMRAARGNILDATGHYLVSSSLRYQLGVSPRLLSESERERLAPKLVQFLNMDEATIRKVLETKDTEYVSLGSDLPASAGAHIEELKSDAFKAEISFRRVYPDASLAASVLGFIDLEEVGQYGLESYYDGALRGQSGEWYGVRDSWGQHIMLSQSGYLPVQDGVDLVLTLDRNVQYAVEQMLAEGIKHNKATMGNIVVLDASTAAVLAMANYPSYEPGRYGYVASPEYYINSSVSSIYEPGSVLKPLTLAAALESKVILPTDTYDDRGNIDVGGRRILNSDRRSHGLTTMGEILSKSLNVGAAHVAVQLGPTRYYEMMRRFGLGEPTGIDLALEAAGIMRVPGDSAWNMSDLGANSYGQGISLTPIQIASAFVALANEGTLMRPYIVSEFRSSKTTRRVPPFPLRRAISPETAHTITEMLVEAVEDGMKLAIVPGYRFAGKSGTAGIPDQEGYQAEDIIASFVGYGPIPNPRFVVLVKFDKPKEGYWGVDVAAPEFRKVAQFLVDYYGIPPSQTP